MILCLDVGNSQLYGGVFKDGEIIFNFRNSFLKGRSSDEFGLFLRAVLRENNIDPDQISKISICTVVPEVLHSIKNCCKKYFKMTPFVLQVGSKTGLKINYRNPLEVGADRIANAIAATHLFPNQNLLIIDFGTATTFCAISKHKEYLGGAILAGLKISMQSLVSNTSKLPAVEIVVPPKALGRSTVENIQSGLFFGNLGAIKELKHTLSMEAFNGEEPIVIGTGGFTGLFKSSDLFSHEMNNLVLKGLYLALKMNPYSQSD